MTLRPSLLALFASLTVFAVGCAGVDGSTDERQEGATSSEVKAGHHEISQQLLCAAVAEAEQASDGVGLVGISFRDLKGDAKRDFKEFQRGMENDFPSEAFEMPVKLGAKTYDFILV